MPTTTQQSDAVSRLVRESVRRIDAIAPDQLRSIIPVLVQARDELRRDLSKWLATVDGADRFTAYQKAQALRALEATFERLDETQPVMSKALGLGRKETGPLAVENLHTEVQRLSAIYGGGVPTLPQIDTAAIIAQGNKLLWRRHENSAKRYAGGLGDDIKTQFAVALAKGETFEQMTQRLRKLGGFRAMVGEQTGHGENAAAISDAMFHRWRHWADRLVRTENMTAYNVQHDLSIEHVNENRGEGEDEYLRRWDASADRVTCERCKELDRTLATIDGTFRYGYKSPPAHPYCRCVVLAWLARWGNFKGEVPAKDHEGKDIAPVLPKPKPVTKPAPKERKPSLPPDSKSSTISEGEWETNKYGVTGKVLEGDHGVRVNGTRRGGSLFVQDHGEDFASKPYPRENRYTVSGRSLRDGKGFGSSYHVGNGFDTAEEAIAAARKSLENAGKVLRRKIAQDAANPPEPKPGKPAKADPGAPHDTAIAALAETGGGPGGRKRRWGEARNATEDAFTAQGLAPKNTVTGKQSTSIKKLPQGIGGYRKWTGEIEIADHVAENGEKFAQAWAKDPTARAKLEAFNKWHREHYATEYATPQEATQAMLKAVGSGGEHNEAARMHLWAKSHAALVHEAAHGYGPTKAGQYTGMGVHVEEVTTETIARTTMRERFGVDMRAIVDKKGATVANRGAYEDMIQQTTEAIMKARGIKRPAAEKVLERAAAHYKAQAEEPIALSADKKTWSSGGLAPIERFAESIAASLPESDLKYTHDLKPGGISSIRSDGSLPTQRVIKIEQALYDAWKAKP